MKKINNTKNIILIREPTIFLMMKFSTKKMANLPIIYRQYLNLVENLKNMTNVFFIVECVKRDSFRLKWYKLQIRANAQNKVGWTNIGLVKD